MAVATTAATMASHRLKRNAFTNPADSKNFAYQRSENPVGGKVLASAVAFLLVLCQLTILLVYFRVGRRRVA